MKMALNPLDQTALDAANSVLLLPSNMENENVPYQQLFPSNGIDNESNGELELTADLDDPMALLNSTNSYLAMDYPPTDTPPTLQFYPNHYVNNLLTESSAMSSQYLNSTSGSSFDMAYLSTTASGRLDGSSRRYTCEELLNIAHSKYQEGLYKETIRICNFIYQCDAFRVDNLLLLGAAHFQLRNFPESIFYNQQCIRIQPGFAEAYGNLGNALKEIGKIDTAIECYLTAIKLKPRFGDAYNNLASVYIQNGQYKAAIETYHMSLLSNPLSVEAHCNLGHIYKIQGYMNEAKQCYERSLELQSNYAIAWSHLATLYKETGQHDLAVTHYLQAIRCLPTFAEAYSNLGNVYKEMGRTNEAIAAYHKAIELRPDFAIAHGNLASCFYDMGQMETAIRIFRQAISIEPNFPDAYNNLGNALRERAHNDNASSASSDKFAAGINDAIACYHRCLQLKPDHPHAYNNLGNAFKDKGMIKEAIHCYTTATKLMPNFAAAHSNLGSILKEQGHLEQALMHYQQAIIMDPKFADAYSNMGNVYKDLNRLDESIQCYSTAIRLKPDFADAYSNLASAYKDGGKIDDAITCYRKALDLKPDFPDAHANYVHSMVFICDWTNREKNFSKLSIFLSRQLHADGILPSVQPFHALVYPFSMEVFQRIAAKYAQRAKLNISLHEPSLFKKSEMITRCGHLRRCVLREQLHHRERIRVGYVSSDFGNHPLSHLMQSVFGMHDKSAFEVFCYAISPHNDSIYRRRIATEVEHFIDISSYSNIDAVRLITSHKIHILVNLNGYTKGARNEIFALQPAPIQVSYMGFCGTLGADYIDYMVGDPFIVPESLRQYYTEKIIYLPHSYFVNDHKQSARDVLDPEKCPTRAKYGIPEDKFVFCNFNQVYKIDPDTFKVWTSILKRVPNSILWLLRFPPLAEENIRREALKHGLEEGRIFFTDVAPKEEHLKRGVIADLFLDTPECNGHTTGCDILWSGTPMLTMYKDRMATRVASSLLRAINCPELISTSLEEYEEKAVDYATDIDKLNFVRQKLENNRERCPLFDTERWVRNLEEGYRLAWRKEEQREDPTHIFVDDVYGENSCKPIET